MAKIINPLAFNVPIVDPKTGFPTEYFKRILEDISDAKISASLIDALGGDPDEDQVVTWDDTAGDLAFKPASDVLDMIDDEHGAILYRDSAEWLPLAPGADGDVLTTHGTGADPTWETPSAGGGGGAWQSIAFWDFAVHGAVAEVVADVTAYDEVFVLFHATTAAGSVHRAALVSVDNGATYYGTSGNYQDVGTNGNPANQPQLFAHSTASGLARTGWLHFRFCRSTRSPKPVDAAVRTTAQIFVASASPITHVKALGTSNGGTSVSNLTGGTVEIFGR